ncbi:MAG: peptidoglycan-binding domain-containing protein [Clostridia bacterium]|nr:peptidoglycan-binding domain-containing protein [Clostridia bacterium]
MRKFIAMLLVIAFVTIGNAFAVSFDDYKGVWVATAAESNGKEISLDETGADFRAEIVGINVIITSEYFRYNHMEFNSRYNSGVIMCRNDVATMRFELKDDNTILMHYSNDAFGIDFNMTLERSENDVAENEVTPVQEATPAPTPEPTATPTPEPGYETLQKGSKGEAVKRLQERLIELNYLTGSADGDFGNKTKEAVEKFQRAAGFCCVCFAFVPLTFDLYTVNAHVGELNCIFRYTLKLVVSTLLETLDNHLRRLLRA